MTQSLHPEGGGSMILRNVGILPYHNSEDRNVKRCRFQ